MTEERKFPSRRGPAEDGYRLAAPARGPAAKRPEAAGPKAEAGRKPPQEAAKTQAPPSPPGTSGRRG